MKLRLVPALYISTYMCVFVYAACLSTELGIHICVGKCNPYTSVHLKLHRVNFETLVQATGLECFSEVGISDDDDELWPELRALNRDNL